MGIEATRWKAELVAGLVVAGAGGFFLTIGLRLPPPDEPGVPGPGSAPIILGGLIALCGLAIAIGGVLKADRSGLDLGGPKQAIAFAILMVGTLVFEPAGFMLSTFVFLSTGFTLLGGADWKHALPTAALTSGALWLIFTKLLGVGLPYGLIGEILFR